MAIQPIAEFPFPHLPEAIVTTPSYAGSASYDITAAGGYAAYVGQATDTFTVDTVFFKVGTAGAGNSLTARVALENVSLATGLPNLSLINPSASAAIQVTTAGNYQVRFPGSVTVNRGDYFAIVIQALAGSAPNLCRFSVFADDNPGYQFPYTLDAATGSGSPVITRLAPGIGLALSGVSGVPTKFCWPMDAVPGSNTFKSPGVYGNKITVYGKVRASGVTFWGAGTLGAGSVKGRANLYDNDGVTVLASAVIEPQLPSDSGVENARILFPTPVTIDPGTYYLGVSSSAPAGGSGSFTLYYASFSESVWRESSPFGGKDVVYSTTTGSPTGIDSWTNVNTRQNFLGLMIDGVEDGSGGGGGGGETSFAYIV